MGVKITDLLIRHELDFAALGHKKLTVDSFNVLYQFLSTIRQRDGTLLTDSQGNVTSHLIGLFSRTANLMQKDIKLAFVFDGTPPELKFRERQRRADLKKDAQERFEKAKDEEDVDGMKKYAARTSKLTKEMVDEAKDLISALGLPVIQAPSEGEAQASYMIRRGDIYGIASQDADSLLFGAPRLIRNLTISQRKKLPGKFQYQDVRPELVDLSETLNSLGIDHDSLICLAILIGTDFNIGGIPGIGPKKALNLVKEHGSDHDSLFRKAGWDDNFDYPWQDVFNLFKDMPATDDYRLEWVPPDFDKVVEILVERHDFARERVDSALEKLRSFKVREQKGLGEWFG
ncbi:flap endonuclease-1 [Candidatus Woesearchaeota archaeon]|nr:flap endonuclease-1 [Candidatus Woesearchaeota archaeon]